MANVGIKFTQSGIAVPSATPQQLLFTSGNNNLKIVQSGIATYTFSSNPSAGQITLATIAHGLGYVPAHDVFYKFYDPATPYTEYSHMPYVNIAGGLATSTYIFNSYCDSTNLVIRFSRVDTGGGAPLNYNGTQWSFKYRIFADEGA